MYKINYLLKRDYDINISCGRVFIVGGTSLTVQPAASLIRYFNGEKLVLINKESTQYDQRADLLISDGIGKVFESIWFN